MKLRHDELRCDECGLHPFDPVEDRDEEGVRFTRCGSCGQPLRLAAVEQSLPIEPRKEAS